MVENNELSSESTMDSKNVQLITDQKKLLEETTLDMQKEIKNCFEHLASMLKSREKQLLRQVEAVHVQQLWLIQSDLELVLSKPLLNINFDGKHDIQNQILHLGKLEILGQNCLTVKDTELCKVEDYQEANRDHESFNKSIKCECNDRSPLAEMLGACGSTGNLTNPGASTNTPVSEDSILNSSGNSSLDSNVENEITLTSKVQKQSIINCLVVENKFISNSNQPLTIEIKLDCEGKNNVENMERLSSSSHSSKMCNSTNDCAAIENSGTNSENYNVEQNQAKDSHFYADINANKKEGSEKGTTGSDEYSEDEHTRRDSCEHPKQIQQWLQQILVETEIEPMIHDIEQFSEISKVRLSGQFPLET